MIAETTPELGYAVVYISTEDMTQGGTYQLSAGTYSESITLSDLMYSTLSGGMGGSLGGGGPRGGMNDGFNSGGMHPGGMRGGNGQTGGHGPGGNTDGMTGATQLNGDETV